MNDLQKSISEMIPEGNRLNLPEGFFSNYKQVKTALIKAGGKYSRNGFIFNESAADIQSRLVGGEAIDDIKKFQYFPTPRKIADMMREFLELEEHMRVLEPSAGQGALVEGLGYGAGLDLVEIMPQNLKVLNRLYGDEPLVNVIEGDYMQFTPSEKYDRIIANPPFTKNQDIDHVTKMLSELSSIGRLVTVMSNSWRRGSQKKQIAFREQLETLDHVIYELEAGSFKSSGTNIACCLLIVDA